MSKKGYATPRLRVHGNVEELTRRVSTGTTAVGLTAGTVIAIELLHGGSGSGGRHTSGNPYDPSSFS